MEAERQCEEVKIEMPWGHISGKWYGDQNEQPVLAVHGWMDNAGSFDRLIPLLPKNIANVLCIDLPGHGRSSHFPVGTNYHIFWDFVPIIRRVVKHFKWTNIKLLGHSLGGTACFMYSALYPREVDKIILIDSCPVVKDEKKVVPIIGSLIDKIHAMEMLTPEKQPRFTKDEVINMMLADGSIDRDSAMVLLKRCLNPTGGDGKHTVTTDARLRISGLGLLSLEQALTYAEFVQCHVLIIRASPGITLERPDVYPKVLSVLKKKANVEHHEVDGSHHVHIQSPERIANIITTFLLNINEE